MELHCHCLIRPQIKCRKFPKHCTFPKSEHYIWAWRAIITKRIFLCFQQIKRKTVQLFRWSVSPRCTAVIEIYLTRFLFPIPSGENGRNQSTGQTTRNSTATWQSTEHLNRSYIRKSIYPPWLFDAVGAFALILFYTYLHFQKEAPERMWNWREKKEKIKRALKRNGKTCTERT